MQIITERMNKKSLTVQQELSSSCCMYLSCMCVPSYDLIMQNNLLMIKIKTITNLLFLIKSYKSDHYHQYLGCLLCYYKNFMPLVATVRVYSAY